MRNKTIKMKINDEELRILNQYIFPKGLKSTSSKLRSVLKRSISRSIIEEIEDKTKELNMDYKLTPMVLFGHKGLEGIVKFYDENGIAKGSYEI